MRVNDMFVIVECRSVVFCSSGSRRPVFFAIAADIGLRARHFRHQLDGTDDGATRHHRN